MRIFCSICKDIFIPDSDIYATNCGHLYHGSCIFRWCESRNSCPQCRSAQKLQPIKIFLDVEKGNGPDVSVLEHQIEILNNELRAKDLENKELIKNGKKFEKTISCLEECTAGYKVKNDMLKSSIKALKEQIATLTKKSEKSQELKNDFKMLQNKLKNYER